MSKLEELIEKLCPGGVAFRTVGDVLGVNRGKRLTKSQLFDADEYYVYHGSKDVPLGRYRDFNVDGDTVIVVNTGGIGGVKYCERPFWCSDGSFHLGKSKVMNNKFVFYYIQQFEEWFKTQKRVGGVPTIDRATVENVKIPLPPLPVQREIVRILDTFTAMNANLEEELAARRKQYAEYLERVIPSEKISRGKNGLIANCFPSGYEFRPISACVLKCQNMKWNEANGKYQYIDLASVDVDRHCIIATTPIDKNNAPSRAQQIVNTNDILFGTTRPLQKRYVLIDNAHDGNICSTGFCVLRPNPLLVLPSWIKHILASSSFYEHVSDKQKGASYPMISDSDTKAYRFALPPLPVQRKIVRDLDAFTGVIANIESELALRRKQYEYYRDKLLAFKEA